MRWVPGVLTDPPGRAPRGPAMGISGLQRRCNQRLRLPGNKKRTHSRGSHPHSQSRSRGPALLGSQPSAQLLLREGSWAPGQRTPEAHGT